MVINKYDYITGKILATYDCISEASYDNHITYVSVMKMLKRYMIKYPRRDYYLGYTPKPRWVIRCFDNESLELLGTYINEKEASEKTGVNAQHIGWTVRKDKPLRDRWCGSTGLFFQRVVIDY